MRRVESARDIVDWVSANDVIYHVWDARRLQAIKAARILAKQIEVIEGLLKSTYDPGGPERSPIYYISGMKDDARRCFGGRALVGRGQRIIPS